MSAPASGPGGKRKCCKQDQFDAADPELTGAPRYSRFDPEPDSSEGGQTRSEAMEQRLEAMLQAVQTVLPALERFYGSLSGEQKERFNRLTPRRDDVCPADMAN